MFRIAIVATISLVLCACTDSCTDSRTSAPVTGREIKGLNVDKHTDGGTPPGMAATMDEHRSKIENAKR